MSTTRSLVEELTRLRAVRGWNQTDLAGRLGVTPAALNHWEAHRRQPSLGNLRRWARELGYEVAFELEPSQVKRAA